jgi:hypothetical protein
MTYYNILHPMKMGVEGKSHSTVGFYHSLVVASGLVPVHVLGSIS